MKYSILTLVACIAFSAGAGPDDGSFGEFLIQGDACKNSDTRVLVNGDTLAILFDGFGINMPANVQGDGLEVRKNCRFKVQITPPRNSYLESVEQAFSGGLIKSRKSRAAFNIGYRIGQRTEKPVRIVWEQGRSVLPGALDSFFQEIAVERLETAPCRRKENYVLNLVFNAHRADRSEYVIGGLDSVDARFVQQVRLKPRYARCR